MPFLPLEAGIADGQELPDWKKQPTISEYSNQLGDQGWELVTLMSEQYQFDPYIQTSYYQLVFKHPK